MDVAEVLDRGLAAYWQGDRETFRASAEALRDGFPQYEAGWGLFALEAFGNADCASLERIMGDWEARGGSGLSLAQKTLRQLLNFGAYEAIVRLWRTYPPDGRFRPVITYFLGCSMMMQGDPLQAMEVFLLFASEIRRCLGQEFFTDASLNVIFRQGRLMAPPREVERRLAEFGSASEALLGIPPAEEVAAEPAAGPVYFAVADALYVKALGGMFAEGVFASAAGRETCLHVVQIGPFDPQASEFLAGLRRHHGSRFGFTCHPELPFRTVPSFTCARFFVVDRLLEIYSRPLVSLDIDIVPADPLAGFLATCAEADFACFETGRNEPASVMQASVMVWTRTASATAYRQRLRAFVWPELHQPTGVSWQIDQAALYAVRLALAGRPEGFEFRDLRQVVGVPLEEAVIQIADSKTKGRLIDQNRAREPSRITL